MEGSALSSGFQPTAGVPQGSPFSPLVFLLYTAGAPLPRGGCIGTTAYADDHAFWATAPDPRQAWQALQPKLDDFTKWCAKWRLVINPTKTQLLYLSRRLTWREEHFPSATLLDQPVQRASEIRLLGVTLDQRLTFAPHARHLLEKLQPRVLQLRRLMSDRQIGCHIGRLLYKTFLRPVMTYGAPAMLTSSDTVWANLQRLERMAIRSFLRVPVSIPNIRLQSWGRVQDIRAHYQDASTNFLRWLKKHNNRRVLNSLPDPGGVPHRTYKKPPLNAALELLPSSEQSAFTF